MASSGSFSGSIYSGHYSLRVNWNQVANVSANTSTITCDMYLVNDYSLNISSRTDNTVTIDGTSQTFSSPAISTTGTHLLSSKTQTVSHNSDGTKSITISAVFNIRATLSGTYYSSITASATITLDTIPRASSVYAPSVTMGSPTTISIDRASTSFTHTLTYCFGTSSGTIATNTSSTSISWTPPVSLASQIPNAISGIGTITCTTYSGTTNIGSKSCTIILTVPSTVKPTITSLTATRVDGSVPSSWGIYVQTKSKATLTINGASGSYGSTISSYSISGGGYTGTGSIFTTGFLNTAGNVTFTATVTDSRGRTSSAATVSITVEEYVAPSFESYLSQRCNSEGVVIDDGTYIRGLLAFHSSSCNSNNAISTAIKYKKTTESSWTNVSNTFSSGNAVIFGDQAISTESCYDIQYTITDSFTSVSIQDMVSTARVIMDFKSGGLGLAIGKVAEYPGLDIDWDTTFRQPVSFNQPVSFYQSVSLQQPVTFQQMATFQQKVTGIPHTFYGSCSTSSGTSAKVVSCTNFVREIGSVITIYMTNANTTSYPSLNINSTGSAYLSYGGVRISGANQWLASSMLTVMFTGTYYEVLSIGASWTPSLSGCGSYTAREGNFSYSGGVVSINFGVKGTFSSSTTIYTESTITGFPFSNAGACVAAGSGVAYGGYCGSGLHFNSWIISNGSSSIVGRVEALTASYQATLGSLCNYPSASFVFAGTIQMRVLA